MSLWRVEQILAFYQMRKLQQNGRELSYIIKKFLKKEKKWFCGKRWGVCGWCV